MLKDFNDSSQVMNSSNSMIIDEFRAFKKELAKAIRNKTCYLELPFQISYETREILEKQK